MKAGFLFLLSMLSLIETSNCCNYFSSFQVKRMSVFPFKPMSVLSKLFSSLFDTLNCFNYFSVFQVKRILILSTFFTSLFDTLEGCNYFSSFPVKRVFEDSTFQTKHFDQAEVTPENTDEEAVMLIGGKFKSN
jgi:hypothetical protein